ncbi:hypothetical protein H4R99_003494 [Coemansia sp. RSA 1722]|nr:hypothetical protein H4R99_003494 [Coemansia sp. RSA 1722]
MTKELTGRACRIYTKARCAIKQKYSKISSKAAPIKDAFKSLKSKAAKNNANRASYYSECSETTAVEAQPVPVDLIADELIDAFSASDDCESFAEEIDSIRSSPVCKLKLADRDVAPLACLTSALENHRELLLDIEETHCFVLPYNGMRIHYDNPQLWRISVADSLFNDAAKSGNSRKTLHTALVYLDLFLLHCKEPISQGRIHVYGFVCLFFARMTQEQAQVDGQPGREYPETPFINRFLTDAAEHILDTLGWCLKRDNSCADIFVRQVVELPTVIDFLDLAFQRAAIVLPELLGDQPALEAAEAQPSNGHACARIPRLYATQSFVYACDIADMLAYDHGSQRFSASRLAAVSFYFVAAHNGFDDSMFEACTGYTVLDIKPVVARTIALLVSIYGRPGLSMGDVLCCSEKARYKYHRGKVEPEQQWLLQPFHAHIKDKFEHAHCRAH